MSIRNKEIFIHGQFRINYCCLHVFCFVSIKREITVRAYASYRLFDVVCVDPGHWIESKKKMTMYINGISMYV